MPYDYHQFSPDYSAGDSTSFFERVSHQMCTNSAAQMRIIFDWNAMAEMPESTAFSPRN